MIYTHHYTERETADVFKYYDDSQHMYNALDEEPTDYLRMLVGIGNDTPHFDQYYSKMLNWKRQFENQVYNDHQVMIRLNAFLRLFSFGSYHVHTIIMCFFSLLGLVCIFKALARFFDNKYNLLAACIFLVPSVIFWGSPVLKEGVVLLGMGLLLLGFFSIQHSARFVAFLCLGIGLFILIYVKLYVLLALLPALAAYLLAKRLWKTKPIASYALVIVLCSTGVAVINSVANKNTTYRKYDVLKVIQQKQADFIGLANGGVYLEDDMLWVYVPDDEREILTMVDSAHYQIKLGSSYPIWHCIEKDTEYVTNSTDTTVYHVRTDSPPSGSKIDMPALKPTIASFAQNSPRALYNALFLPWIFQSRNMFETIAGAENLGIILFCLVCLLFMKKTNAEQRNLFWMCLTFSVITLLLIGWTTTVTGAIVRYRVPVYPLLLPALLLLLNTTKLPAKWKILHS